jgi:hypothetical protein
MPVRCIVGKTACRSARESGFDARRFRAGRGAWIANNGGMNAPSDRPRYRISVHRAAGGYVARVAALPGCACRGATAVEAIENVRAAIRAHQALTGILAGEAAVVEIEITA